MLKILNGLLVFVLAGWVNTSYGSLLNDDSIDFSVNLTTSSGNSISASGTFSPGADVYCFDFSAFGPCPPGPLFDTEPSENMNGDSNLFLLFNAEEESISVFIGDSVVDVPEHITGTVIFSDIGWGETPGQIVGGEVCGIGAVGCGPDFGFETEYASDSVTIGIDSFLSIFSSSSGDLSGIGQTTVHLEVEHAPSSFTPVPVVPVLGLAILALGLIAVAGMRPRKEIKF